MGSCIFVPFIRNFGREVFYNSQEVGFVKELSKNEKVTIFKLVSNIEDIQIIVNNPYKYYKKNNIEFIPYIGVIENSLEWLHTLFQNSKYLWKKYLVTNIKFIELLDKREERHE